MEKKEGAWVVGPGWVTVQRRDGVRDPPSRDPHPTAGGREAGKGTGISHQGGGWIADT